MPNELDVLHEDFLKTHCFVAEAARGAGEVGLRFRPLRTRRNFLDILGTIWLDSATYLARRLELEYVDFDESRGTVRVDFADLPVAGGTLRMPVGGRSRCGPREESHQAHRGEVHVHILRLRGGAAAAVAASSLLFRERVSDLHAERLVCLGPVNEQLRADNDPWLEWIRAEVAKLDETSPN